MSLRAIAYTIARKLFLFLCSKANTIKNRFPLPYKSPTILYFLQLKSFLYAFNDSAGT